jgi:hypothetical protein
MTYLDRDLVEEVRQNRELLLTKYGGIEGLHKHMDEERAELEMQGWKFMSLEDILLRKHGAANRITKNQGCRDS